MRFFLAGRDRSTGSVRLVSETTFSSRQDALDSLGALLPVDGSFEGLDLFVADIEKSTPVVIYKPVVVEPLVGTPVDEPIADAWESPASAVADLPLESAVAAETYVEEPYAEAIIAELEAVVAEAADVRMEPEGAAPLPLVDALRRAADRMEADGVVAPEPVGEPVSVVEDVASEPAFTKAPVLDEIPDAAPEVTEPADDFIANATFETPIATQWPWETAGAESAPAQAEDEPFVEETAAETSAVLVSVPDPVSVPDLVSVPDTDDAPVPVGDETDLGATHDPVGLDEATHEDGGMLPSPVDEFVAKPVIMGDYGATPVSDAVETPAAPVPGPEAPAVLEEEFAAALLPDETTGGEGPDESEFQAPTEPMGLTFAEPEVAFAPMGIPPVVDAVATAQDVSGADDTAADELVVEPSGPSDEPQPEPLDDLLAAIGEPAPAAEPKVYSHSGIDMNAYTCEDCVYVGTCPKANEDSPATCGSFQWKSV